MSSQEFGSLTLLLFLLLAAAHLLGLLFKRLRQPRVVGEILAGLLLGPSVLGRVFQALPDATAPLGAAADDAGMRAAAVLGFLYNLGLLLLMFASGAEAKGLLRASDRRAVGWLTGVGTGLPFLVVFAGAPFIPWDLVEGQAAPRLSLLLVVGIAIAVTSIPVISKIFHDLGIITTRFARLVLGVAVVEDMLLWAVLSVALGLATTNAVSTAVVVTHVTVTAVFFACGLTILPALTRRFSRASWNVLARDVPVAYIVTMLLALTTLASMLDVALVFAAFLAGYAVANCEGLAKATAILGRVSFAVFVPLYFAMVGYRLDVTQTFPVAMLLAVLVAACALKLAAAALGARMAGFRGRDSLNLSIVLNARGGPGIVLASVAHDAQIINAEFYTCLVVLAVLTSQAAGAWLDYVIGRGWPLLSGEPSVRAASITSGDTTTQLLSG
jgi:Kef-type K+ transport system membrane component KefB